MKKIYFFIIVILLITGQVFAQNFTKVFYRPAGCYGSGAVVNNESGEVLLRVDEPQHIFIHRLKMELTFQKKGKKIYFMASNGRLYLVKNLSIRWQKVANVDNRYLAGEDFNWVHYGHWIIKRPLKSLL